MSRDRSASPLGSLHRLLYLYLVGQLVSLALVRLGDDGGSSMLIYLEKNVVGIERCVMEFILSGICLFCVVLIICHV